VQFFSGYLGVAALSGVQFRTNTTQPTKVRVHSFEQQIKATSLF